MCQRPIDNDLEKTDYTFGYQTAVQVACDALDRLQTTPESHDRVMILEVMGRKCRLDCSGSRYCQRRPYYFDPGNSLPH
ncbi:MAG: 6-phosphofructokinase [Desulfobacterales bacterium]